ncbi:MAG: hypothetical protein ACI83H_002287 [Glaciecola sp.]|jgi:hypothetical protein
MKKIIFLFFTLIVLGCKQEPLQVVAEKLTEL